MFKSVGFLRFNRLYGSDADTAYNPYFLPGEEIYEPGEPVISGTLLIFLPGSILSERPRRNSGDKSISFGGESTRYEDPSEGLPGTRSR